MDGTDVKLGASTRPKTNEKAVARPPLRPTTYISREEVLLLKQFRELTPDERRKVLAIVRKLTEAQK